MDNISFTVSKEKYIDLKKDIDFVKRQLEFSIGSHKFCNDQYELIRRKYLLLGDITPKIPNTDWQASDYDIALTQSIAFTLAKSPRGRWNETFPVLAKYLNNGGVKWILWPEFTLMGQIHYHLALKILDHCAYQKLIARLKLNLGNILVKFMDSPDNWIKYCQKQQNDMEKLLDVKLPILSGEPHWRYNK